MPRLDITKACTLSDLARYKLRIDRLKLGIKHSEPYDEQFKALGVTLDDKPNQEVILQRLDEVARERQVGPYRRKAEVGEDPPEPPIVPPKAPSGSSEPEDKE